MRNSVAGFDWDHGNWPKCGKHGVSRAEIEAVTRAAELMVEDPFEGEQRVRFIGQTDLGRYMFVAATYRRRAGLLLIRPISARYMHQREIDDYRKAKETLAASDQR